MVCFKKILINILISFKLILIVFPSFALKDCPRDQQAYKHNCYGKYEFDSGEKYIGEWANDKRNGKGTNVWVNGKKYVGEWKDNKVHGFGEMTTSDITFKGDFKNDIPNGKGEYKWNDGHVYLGEVKNGMMHGYGTMKYPTGNKYEGNFIKSKRDGFGSFLFINGDKYVGQWKNDKSNGIGTFTSSDGTKFTGEWKDNKKHGYGTLIKSNGTTLKGEWKDDYFNGKKLKFSFKDSLDLAKNGDYVSAVNIWKDLDKKGHVGAQYNLGNAYSTGKGVQLNHKKAFEYWLNSALGGHPLGQVQTGVSYATGEGVKQNYNEAIKWYKKASSQGVDIAKYNLGWLYEKGKGVDQNYKKAFEFYLSAAESEFGPAQGSLGWLYYKGLGVNQDYDKAYSLFEKAIENGYTQANTHLGLMFLRGRGVEKDIAKGITYLKIAAENGSVDAKNLLKLYQNKNDEKKYIEKKVNSNFPTQPIIVDFKKIEKKSFDIAVIIGNANYKKQGKDIPNVNPAYADAEGIKQYFMKAKGIKEGNIIYLKDATGAQLVSVFGNEKSHKGKLFNYIRPNKSNVYIYYAGHGAPGEEGDAYLVPTDTDSQTIQLTGYALSTLYSNLGKLPAKSVTVILEACFSGGSQSGSLISKASPIIITPKKTMIPANIKVIAAGSESQMASWEEDSSHSLFTKYFLKAMSGEGDSNKDGKVSDTELKEYLSDTMTYYARRYYGRDQKVQIHNGG